MFAFGKAVELLKEGERVYRQGWNGKGMFLFLVKGEAVTEAIEDHYGDPEAKGVHKVHDASPPHRRLRNRCGVFLDLTGPSPPHRRLRNLGVARPRNNTASPPHRRLRKNSAGNWSAW